MEQLVDKDWLKLSISSQFDQSKGFFHALEAVDHTLHSPWAEYFEVLYTFALKSQSLFPREFAHWQYP